MKKIITIALILTACATLQTKAQGFGDILKKAAAGAAQNAAKNSGNSTLSTLAGVAANLLGTENVSEASIVGTWSYVQPCVAFESQNVLANAGATVASQSIEKKMQKFLGKAGFTQGKVTLTFNEDKSATLSFAGKSFPCTWSLEDSNLILKLGSPTANALAGKTGVMASAAKFTSIKMNVKIVGNELQIAMDATKFSNFIKAILDKSGSALSSISALAKNVQGLYLGMKFSK